jgi:phosphatidylglycerol:prolipoprotein diacylglycerol transferase
MNPICFHIGSHPIYWYGVMMALAFMAGLLHWHWLGHKTRRDTALASDLAFWLMVGGILGARIAYVISNFDYFRAAPQEIIRVDQGGLIFYGGLIGGVLAFLVLSKWRRLKVWDLADFTVTALPLGHALGRVGCFLNGCCGGCEATSPSFLTGGLARYPVQLYEAFFNLGVYGLLTWYLLYKRGTKYGSVVALYLMSYPIVRFLLEFIRGDDRMRAGGLDVAQIISLSLILVGIVLWIFTRKNGDQTVTRPS